jgi:hypothetical protein
MTKLLDQAVSKVRELPEADQDAAAELLFLLMAKRAGPVHLDDETRAAVREGLQQARRGEIASDKQIAALFRSHK